MPVSSPTALQLGQIVAFSSPPMLVPKASGTVTPSAGALVILLIQYAGGADTVPTPVQPSWAAQAWTPIAVTTESGSAGVEVAAWWTIATASPGAAGITINFSGGGFDGGIGAGGALFECASGFDPISPIRQSRIITAASLAGDASLTDTFALEPLSGSQLLEIGMGAGNATQFFANPAAGWTKPTPADEGFNQTSYVAYANGSNGSTYGGDFGDATPGHDHPDGVVFLAFEIQEPSAGPAIFAGSLVDSLRLKSHVNGGLVS